eukprot:129239_1
MCIAMFESNFTSTPLTKYKADIVSIIPQRTNPKNYCTLNNGNMMTKNSAFKVGRDLSGYQSFPSHRTRHQRVKGNRIHGKHPIVDQSDISLLVMADDYYLFEDFENEMRLCKVLQVFTVSSASSYKPQIPNVITDKGGIVLGQIIMPQPMETDLKINEYDCSDNFIDDTIPKQLPKTFNALNLLFDNNDLNIESNMNDSISKCGNEQDIDMLVIPTHHITSDKILLHDNLEYIRLITFKQLRSKIHDIYDPELISKLSLNSLMTPHIWKKHYNKVREDMTEYKYVCPYCKKGFVVRAEDFRKHISACGSKHVSGNNEKSSELLTKSESSAVATKHSSAKNDKPSASIKPKPPPSPFKFQCQYCLKPYKTKKPYENHLQKKHNKSPSSILDKVKTKIALRKYNYFGQKSCSRTSQVKHVNQPPPHGIKAQNNLGRTCYMNSVNNVLIQTEDIHIYFTSKQYLQHINHTNKYRYIPHPGLLIKAFGSLKHALFTSNKGIHKPSTFQQTAANIDDRWITGLTNDVQEYVVWILQGMHQDINVISNPKRFTYPRATVYYDKDIAEQSWNLALTRDQSIFINTFYGQTSSTKQCEECKVISTIYDGIFSILDLEIPKSNHSQIPTLYNCLESYVSLQRLTDRDRKRCKRCDRNKELLVNGYIRSYFDDNFDFQCSKEVMHQFERFYIEGRNHKTKLSLIRMPNVLIICLKRFDNELRKIHDPITFKTENLDITPLVCSNEDVIYDLYGVVNHYGEGLFDSYGHYTAYVKSIVDKRWWALDDSRRPQHINDATKIVTNNAYLLFYQKRHMHNRPNNNIQISSYISFILQNKPTDYIVSQIESYHLTVKELKRIQGKGQNIVDNWVSDEGVNAYMMLLRHKSLDIGFHTTFFYVKLSNKDYQSCERYCNSLIKKLHKMGAKVNNIFDLKKLFIPMHVNTNHWVAMIIEMKARKFDFYDSMNNGTIDYGGIQKNGETFLKQQWKKFKKIQFPKWTWNDHKNIYPQQKNVIDCGIFCKMKAKQEIYPNIIINPDDTEKYRIEFLHELVFNNDYGSEKKDEQNEDEDSDVEIQYK